MKTVFYLRSLLLASFLFTSTIQAQDTGEGKKEIDPSNPTNLYTQVNGNLEYQDGKTANLYGLRVNVQYAFNPDNLMLLELPLLHNDLTNKTGFGDMRVRYFHVAKKGITKNFIAIVPFADISIPIGNYENGLGTSSWSLAGGVVGGFIINQKLSLFPGVSYVHITKPSTDVIPEAFKYSSDGIGFQFNASYKFSKSTFMFVNPTPTLLNTNGNWKTFWSGEFNLNHIITPNKFKMNIGCSPNFTNDIYLYKIGATLFI
ncbi:hypothetical protein WMW71_10705 [Flavobacterium buctense]|uniref:Transporter n=1 Tax=Flavobacterium buctense TaxID=1648146 RepID=A0ABU9E2D9_9FLAO|nr:hypothetical protein [Flavobacterium buctense]